MARLPMTREINICVSHYICIQIGFYHLFYDASQILLASQWVLFLVAAVAAADLACHGRLTDLMVPTSCMLACASLKS